MKKFLVAAVASVIFFGGQTQAAPVDNLNAPSFEMQYVKKHGKWAYFRDKYILGRETENERRDRKDWEKRHRYDPPRYRDDDRYRPPSSYYRDDRYYYPPPPPYYRDGRRYYPPPMPPPPTRRR